MRGAVLLILALALAGCTDPGPGGQTTTTQPSTTTPFVPVSEFDGQGAYDWVASILADDMGDPRGRVPGTPEHAITAAWLADSMDLPGWAVHQENFTGSQYLALVEPGDSVHFYVENQYYCSAEERSRAEGLRFQNVIATWDTPSDDVLLLAAHWDAKRHATEDDTDTDAPVPGANDGASGMGVLLQLMEHVAAAELQSPVDLRVVFFDGEDGFEDCHPLAGSVVHAAWAEEAGTLPGRMILLDMVGDAEAGFPRERDSVAADPDLVDLIWGLADDLELETFKDRECDVVDDHMPFIERGVAAVDIIDYRPQPRGGCDFPPYWHTTGDDLSVIDAGALESVGDVLWETLVADQFMATWPA